MKVISLVFAAATAALSCASAQGFSWNGTAAGPCTLTASFPTTPNCPAADDDRRKCQVGVMVKPDGQQVAGAGTIMDPTVVPVEIVYPSGLGCNTGVHMNISVWRQPGLMDVDMAQLTTVNSKGAIDTLTGTSASNAIVGSYKANATAAACTYSYTVDSGACFLSDVPAAQSSPSPAPTAPSAAVAGAHSALAAVLLATLGAVCATFLA